MVYFKCDKDKIRDLLDEIDEIDESNLYIPIEDEEMYFVCPMCNDFKEVRYEDLGYAIQGDIENCVCQECFDKDSYIVPEKYSKLLLSLSESYEMQRQFIMETIHKEHELNEIINEKRGE